MLTTKYGTVHWPTRAIQCRVTVNEVMEVWRGGSLRLAAERLRHSASSSEEHTASFGRS